tara:strand:- start:412 stop:684 length:273 start_codon:yes stop_codon:yes gene_type:complete
MPDRIQRKRTKGWQMPANAIYVGRPTRWGNPYADQDNAELVRLFRENCLTPEFICSVRSELKGKDLACWCPLDQPCHADVLLKIANEEAD